MQRTREKSGRGLLACEVGLDPPPRAVSDAKLERARGAEQALGVRARVEAPTPEQSPEVAGLSPELARVASPVS